MSAHGTERFSVPPPPRVPRFSTARFIALLVFALIVMIMVMGTVLQIIHPATVCH